MGFCSPTLTDGTKVEVYDNGTKVWFLRRWKYKCNDSVTRKLHITNKSTE